MTTVRKVESFDDTKENWETYVERVEQFFLANNIDDDHKVPTLLSLIGGKTYTLLRDLLAPEKPATKPFQQIVTTLQEHLSPKPLEIAERSRSYKRNQHEGESISSYLDELRKHVTAGILTKRYEIDSSVDFETCRSISDYYYCQKPN